MEQISKYLVQYAATPKRTKGDTKRVIGERVLTSSEGLAILKEKKTRSKKKQKRSRKGKIVAGGALDSSFNDLTFSARASFVRPTIARLAWVHCLCADNWQLTLPGEGFVYIGNGGVLRCHYEGEITWGGTLERREAC